MFESKHESDFRRRLVFEKGVWVCRLYSEQSVLPAWRLRMSWSKKNPTVYASDWQATRAMWAARHHPDHECTRCALPLGPMGPWLHLDHDDHDRSVVNGFAHALCNVTAGARKGRAARYHVATLQW